MLTKNDPYISRHIGTKKTNVSGQFTDRPDGLWLKEKTHTENRFHWSINDQPDSRLKEEKILKTDSVGQFTERPGRLKEETDRKLVPLIHYRPVG